MLINTQAACKLITQQDNILILSHQKPDGDTLGSAFALLYALEQLGKTARVECCDGFPERYHFIMGADYTPKEFEPAYIVTVDIASTQLLGSLEPLYAHRVDLCIDHHKSNEMKAPNILLDVQAPAVTQMMYKVVLGLGAEIDRPIANALYTGLATDTGCFKYDNVTPITHRVAADLIEAGAEHANINKLMFDTKSRGRLEIEKILLNNLEYFLDGQCAIITVFAGTPEKYAVTEDELDGISAIPRRIEGVKAGVTIRERWDGTKRVSLRTGDGLDASRICARLGGGGHMNAAGCTLSGNREQVKHILVREIEKELNDLAS